MRHHPRSRRTRRRAHVGAQEEQEEIGVKPGASGDASTEGKALDSQQGESLSLPDSMMQGYAEALKAGLPVIPLRDVVIFPGTVTPLLLGRTQSLSAMIKALEGPQQLAFFTLQNQASEDLVGPETVKAVGTVGRIISSSALPNSLSKILVEAVGVAKAHSWRQEQNILFAELDAFGKLDLDPVRQTHALSQLKISFAEYVAQSPDLPRQVLELIDQLGDPELVPFAIGGHLRVPVHLKQLLLEEEAFSGRLRLLQEMLRNEMEAASLSRRIEHEVRATVAQNQKEFFLTEQLRKIQQELGSSAPVTHPEVRRLEEELKQKGMPPKVQERALAELKRLEYLHPSSPEYSVVRTYVDWFLNLPWGRKTEDKLDLAGVKKQLDHDHHGLKDVKERILEHVAVYQLSRHHATPILCLAGPPGVGKTSLGKSIAAALGRDFVRIALGGIRDEAEVRGHRRTYIGSMPGRIVQALKKAGSMNPVILLDEIDKLGSDFRGDPASALLEVLDPEQNGEFIDHFMEVGIDLSQVFFITTANVEEAIPAPLHDRLEVIRISGYYDSEKLRIAGDHLLPKVRTVCGLDVRQFDLAEPALREIIARYTQEAGVRQLQRQIARIARKRAREVVESGGGQGNVDAKGDLGKVAQDVKGAKVTPTRPAPAGKAKAATKAAKPKTYKPVSSGELTGYLGAPLHKERKVPTKNGPGVVTGLAWTPTGGSILRIECAPLSGKGKLTVTGNLGDVMKESTQIALTLTRERARRYGLNPDDFHKTDIHLHVPEGAIPKDGPSAGMAMTLALLSAVTRRPIDPGVAMTGEVSLVGKVHAIGGLKEKALAALQAGVKTIFVPEENRHDVSELPAEAREGLHIVLVKHVDELLRTLLPPPNEKVVTHATVRKVKKR
jgi:ATP-dependent Lon protease